MNKHGVWMVEKRCIQSLRNAGHESSMHDVLLADAPWEIKAPDGTLLVDTGETLEHGYKIDHDALDAILYGLQQSPEYHKCLQKAHYPYMTTS